MDNQTLGVFFAAGKGSRMAPFTDHTPKPLAKIGDKTILEINLEKSCILCDEIVIIIGHLGDQIIEYFGDNFQGKKISYAWQDNPKGGTLDALRTGIYSQERFLEGYNYFVSNGDNILDASVYTNLKKEIQKDSDTAYLSAKKIEDRELLKSMGIFRVDSDYNFIEIVEKPQEFVSDLANIGTYYLPNNVISLISKKTNPSLEKEEYITDLFNLYAVQNAVKVIPNQAEIFAISSVEDLEKARKELLSS
jgi:NDP-sugar pyrophosphorylase family protein